jgi:hypothetical protein
MRGIIIVRNLLRSECTSQAVLGSPAGALITARSAVLQAALRLSGKPIFAGCGLSNCTGALTYTGCAALREGSWVAPTRQFHSYCKRNPACAMQLTSPSRWSQATSAPPLPGAVRVWRDVSQSVVAGDVCSSLARSGSGLARRLHCERNAQSKNCKQARL